MLQLFSSGLLALWLEMVGVKPTNLNADALLAWQGVPLFVLPTGSDSVVETRVQQYLQSLSTVGMVPDSQRLWMQSGTALLTNHQGTTPVPAASLTKIATTLAALKTWGPTHRFETLVGATGPIKNGVLEGDLVVIGSGDPFFVWEEAIALGHALNQMGIRRVTGNLVIGGDFYMNYKLKPEVSGQLLKLGLNSATWPEVAANQYQKLSTKMPRPTVVISGEVKVASFPIPKQSLLLRHQSMPLAQIIREMNIYSNNEMAQMLANSLGGAQVVSHLAAQAGGFPLEEIQMVNGSGLGLENRISPHAVCTMLMTIERYLQPYQMTLGDLFPVAGHDRRGTLEARHIPKATVVKTGTLDDVSALAGVMPTRDKGLVWFVIMNWGKDVPVFRTEQDQLLQSLSHQWGAALTPPLAITPTAATVDPNKQLGDVSRNEIISNVQANSVNR